MHVFTSRVLRSISRQDHLAGRTADAVVGRSYGMVNLPWQEGQETILYIDACVIVHFSVNDHVPVKS